MLLANVSSVTGYVTYHTNAKAAYRLQPYAEPWVKSCLLPMVFTCFDRRVTSTAGCRALQEQFCEPMRL